MYNIYRPICFYLIIYPPIHLSLNFYLSTEVKSERERGRDKDFGVSLVYTCIKLMLKSRIFITYIIYIAICAFMNIGNYLATYQIQKGGQIKLGMH